jgi:hypothetical protein
MEGGLVAVATVGSPKSNPGLGRPQGAVAHTPPAEGSGLRSQQARRDAIERLGGQLEGWRGATPGSDQDGCQLPQIRLGSPPVRG